MDGYFPMTEAASGSAIISISWTRRQDALYPRVTEGYKMTPSHAVDNRPLAFVPVSR
jgi:hypothetical protein